MRDYELTVLVKPGDEKGLDKEIKALQTTLDKAGAKTLKKNDPLKRPLAYEIGHLREAIYLYYELSLKPAEVAEINNKLKLNENVIRYLLVKKI